MRYLPNVLMLFVFMVPCLQAKDWPQWRGPTGDNHAAADATAPVSWNGKSNLAWVVPVPGRGHSSPTVIGDRIYLTTSDVLQKTQSLLVYDRHNGEMLVEKVVHQGGLTAKMHSNNSFASATVASDGQRVFALFHNNGAVWISAFDLEGNPIWKQRAIGFTPQKYQFGFGSSPVVSDGLVIVSSEYDGKESGIVALDATTGEQRWKTDRPQSLSYSTPALASKNEQRYLLLSGNNRIVAYDLSKGQTMWSTKATSYASCGTMIWDEHANLAFASGGYPATYTLAVRTDGDHEVVWSNNRLRCYEQSMLLVDEYLYLVTDRGIAYCLRAANGDTMWKHRLGGDYSSSPVLIDGKIYVTNQRGTSFVFAASPARFDSLGENQLGTECFATPTPVENRLYHRFAIGAGSNRKEYLAAIGE